MKKSALPALALLFAFLCLVSPCSAKIRAQCVCKHAKSKEQFNLTVDFLSGGELTKITGDKKFHPTGGYAIAWIGGGSYVILTLEKTFFSNPVRLNEVKNGKFRGPDLRGLVWAVTPLQFSNLMQEGDALESLKNIK